MLAPSKTFAITRPTETHGHCFRRTRKASLRYIARRESGFLLRLFRLLSAPFYVKVRRSGRNTLLTVEICETPGEETARQDPGRGGRAGGGWQLARGSEETYTGVMFRHNTQKLFETV